MHDYRNDIMFFCLQYGYYLKQLGGYHATNQKQIRQMITNYNEVD